MLRIKLLGIGCARHKALRVNLEEALQRYPVNAQMTEVTEVNELIRHGISSTPALMVNDILIFENRVASVEELIKIFSDFEPFEGHGAHKNVILVPVDFSESSRNALKFAFEMAPFFDAQIKVLHVYFPETDPTNPYFLTTAVDLNNLKNKRLTEFVKKSGLENTELEVTIEERIKIESTVGLPGESIINFARTERAVMIVMGTTGESDFLKKIFGSISAFVAKNAPCPVLLVPPNARFGGFKNILYASNYYRDDEVLTHKVLDFGKKFKADFHILHLETYPNGYPFDQKYYDLLFKKNAPLNKVVFNRLHAEDTAEGLNQYVQEAGIDLTVLLSRTRGFWQNLLHRSVTRRMSLLTNKPLLIIHLD